MESGSHSRAQSLRQRFAHSRYPSSPGGLFRGKSTLLTRNELSVLLAAQSRHTGQSVDASVLAGDRPPVRADSATASSQATGDDAFPPPQVASLALRRDGSRRSFNKGSWAMSDHADGRKPPMCAKDYPTPPPSPTTMAAATAMQPTVRDRSSAHLPPTTKVSGIDERSAY